MPARKRFQQSALGKKVIMAISGIVLFGFVLTHMLGNLKLYQGAEKLNAYAEWLRVMGAPLLPHGGALWLLRAGLIVAVVVHVVAAYQLTRMNQRARPVAYKKHRTLEATYASRTMRWGGVIILLFVLYHLAHLTWGTVHPDFVQGDVFNNVVAGFGVWWVSALYGLAQVALGFHLYHGLWSMFQTLGVVAPDGRDWRRGFAVAFAWVVTVGNLSFPIAVLTGVVG